MMNYIAHHGTPGQKWGQRHGPPYPLNPNPSKQAKLKANSKSSYATLYKGNSKPQKSKMTRAEKEKLFQLGKTTRVYAQAAKQSRKNAAAGETALAKTKDIINTTKYIDESKRQASAYENKYKKAASAYKKYHSEMQKKYGNRKIKDIEYDDEGYIKARVASNKEIAKKVLSTTGSVALATASIGVGAGATVAALSKVRTLTLEFASDIGSSLVSGAVNEGLSTATLLSTSSKSLGSIASTILK